MRSSCSVPESDRQKDDSQPEDEDLRLRKFLQHAGAYVETCAFDNEYMRAKTCPRIHHTKHAHAFTTQNMPTHSPHKTCPHIHHTKHAHAFTTQNMPTHSPHKTCPRIHDTKKQTCPRFQQMTPSDDSVKMRKMVYIPKPKRTESLSKETRTRIGTRHDRQTPHKKTPITNAHFFDFLALCGDASWSSSGPLCASRNHQHSREK
jgi:hypothetical protein